VAVTLVDWDEIPRWKLISDDLSLGIEEPVETYSTSEHLYSDLSIPGSATGRLPRSKRTRPGLDAEYLDTEGDHGGRRRRDKPGARRTEDDVVTPRPRRSRVRTRSRAGVTIKGPEAAAEAASDQVAPDQVAEGAVPKTGPDAEQNDGAPRTDGARKRRRRRGGARRRENAGVDGVGGETPDAAAS
jgi:hypothetical protein